MFLLISLLCKVYKKKVIVLIDNYDTTFILMLYKLFFSISSSSKPKDQNGVNKFVYFISLMLKFLSDNSDQLEKVVMVGITDILPKNTDGSNVLFFKSYGVLDEGFSSSFGFKEEDIRALADKSVSPSADSDKELLIHNISSWYKGIINFSFLTKKFQAL